MASIYANFEALVNEVLNFGFNDGPQVNRGRIEKWLNEGLFQIARQVDAPEFQAIKTYKTETGVFELELPEGFMRAQDIYLPGMECRLQPVDLQKYNMGNPQLYQGVPQIYTVYKNNLMISPAPQESGEEMVMHYFAEPTLMTAGADVPELNGNYWHLLIDYALVRAFEAEDDYEAAQQFQGRLQRDLASYSTDVQFRIDDRPHIIDGTWGDNYGGSLAQGFRTP